MTTFVKLYDKDHNLRETRKVVGSVIQLEDWVKSIEFQYVSGI